MIVIISSGGHRHCDLCNKCLTEGVLWLPYPCPTIFVERNGLPPMEFEADEWVCCVECSVLVEDRNVLGMIERFHDGMTERHPEHEWTEDAFDCAERLIRSFDQLRAKP